MRPVSRRQPGLQHGLLLLLSHALNFGVDRIPPTTLITIACQSLLYLGVITVPWNAEDVCISTVKIFKNKDWRSFFVSNFEHGSDMHLYYNMVSFLLKGVHLETTFGTVNFAFFIGLLSAGCSAAYVSLGYVLTQITEDIAYTESCAIGFSMILFALKVIVVNQEDDGITNVGGFTVPKKYSVWSELVLIYLLVPNSSFMGHLAGILVGCIYCYTFVGELIDSLLLSITGRPVIHEEKFYRRRTYVF